MRMLTNIALLMFFSGCIIPLGVTVEKSQVPFYLPQPFGTVYVPNGTLIDENGQVKDIAAFWILDTEVTNKEYKVFLEKMGEPDSLKPDNQTVNTIWISDKHNYFTDPMFDDFPVVGLSISQMKAYADWLSLETYVDEVRMKHTFRLPSRSEWMFAAKGGRDSANFPLGISSPRNLSGCFTMHYFDIDQRFSVY